MSLLLDALKKAAEQKAAKSRQDQSAAADASNAEHSVLPGLEPADGDVEPGPPPRYHPDSEPELDDSAFEPRIEPADGGVREDETLIFSMDDVAEIADDDSSIASPVDDDTDLNPLGVESDAAGGIEGDEIEADRLDGDETDLDRFLAAQSAAGQGETGSADSQRLDTDDTDLGLLAAADEAVVETADNAFDSRHAEGGDTDFELLEVPDDEELELQPIDGGETDFDLLSLAADAAEASDLDAPGSAAGDRGAEGGDAGADDEDMSLLLIEREPTQITSPRSTTAPQSPQDALQSLQAEAPTAEDLGLIEAARKGPDDQHAAADDGTHTRNRTGNTSTTQSHSSDTATTGIATATANLGKVPRPDPDAAQNHAPDNYDRTLMRLPNDEAERLFADITSGSEVVMTPDYAKRVFRSKSSASRIQNLKIYVGISVAILLAIAVYGIFEYQSDSESIEAELRPLKNDPMPGTLRTETAGTEPETLFADAEVNQRALEILQNAEISEQPTNADETAPAETGSSGANTAADGNDDSEIAADGSASEMAMEPLPSPTPPQTTESPGAAENAVTQQPVTLSGVSRQAPADRPAAASAATAGSQTGAAASGGSRLQIETGERLEEKQVLLREAYGAFRAGDHALALQGYNRVLEIDPANRNALLARGAIHVHDGDGAAAIKDYQALLLANPKDSLAMASLLAVANVSPLQTETQLKLMIRDEPDSPYLNFALANVYAAQDRWQEAQRYYFTALQNNPDDPNYAYNLAVSLEHISQPRAAVSYYRLALENYNKGLATFSRDAVGRRLEKLANS
jgi:tetratricopeptide (TPR) repeat protein